jgi:hypothetical protein
MRSSIDRGYPASLDRHADDLGSYGCTTRDVGTDFTDEVAAALGWAVSSALRFACS